MSEEKGLSHIAYFRLDGGSCKLYTEEYVNKLEQENKQLKKRYETLTQEHIDTINRNEEKQQRLDKAIEYIKQDNINVEEEKWVKSEILKKYRYSVKSKLLEILGDKENE